MVNTNDYIVPYNDKNMVYDYEENKYVMTVQGAVDKADLDLVSLFQGEENVKRYLYLLSNVVYSVALENKRSFLHDKALWLYSHSKHFRLAFLKIYRDIIWYNFKSGGVMTLYQSGINMQEAKKLELSIKDALSVVGNNFMKITGINERALRYRITLLHKFDTFEELKQYLLENNIYSGTYLENKEKIEDLSSSYKYGFYYDMKTEKYVMEDFTFWNKQQELKGKEW